MKLLLLLLLAAVAMAPSHHRATNRRTDGRTDRRSEREQVQVLQHNRYACVLRLWTVWPAGQANCLRLCYTVKSVRISTDSLWRVFRISTEPVPYTFVSVNRRNNEPRAVWARASLFRMQTLKYGKLAANIRRYTDLFTVLLVVVDAGLLAASAPGRRVAMTTY